MHDKDGKPVGVIAHELKTNTSRSGNNELITSLTNDIENIKVNDQVSNEDLLSYNNPQVTMNKQRPLADAVDSTETMKKYTKSKIDGNDEERFDISSFPSTSNTGLMH